MESPCECVIEPPGSISHVVSYFTTSTNRFWEWNSLLRKVPGVKTIEMHFANKEINLFILIPACFDLKITIACWPDRHEFKTDNDKLEHARTPTGLHIVLR